MNDKTIQKMVKKILQSQESMGRILKVTGGGKGYGTANVVTKTPSKQALGKSDIEYDAEEEEINYNYEKLLEQLENAGIILKKILRDI